MNNATKCTLCFGWGINPNYSAHGVSCYVCDGTGCLETVPVIKAETLSAVSVLDVIQSMIDSGITGVVITSRNRQWDNKLTKGFVIPTLAIAALKAAKLGKRECLQFSTGTRKVLVSARQWKIAEGKQVVTLESPTNASCLVQWLSQ